MIKHTRIKHPGSITLAGPDGTEFEISFRPVAKGEGHISIHKKNCGTEVVLIIQATDLGLFVSWKENKRSIHEYAFHLSEEYATHHAGPGGMIFKPKPEANSALLAKLEEFIIHPTFKNPTEA